MKKLWMIAALGILLAGCGAEATYETVADEVVQAVMAEPAGIHLTLPEETMLPAMETDAGTIYLCDGYDIMVQTLDGGDLNETVRTISGCNLADLTVMQTETGGITRYEFVWTAAGETGQQVARAAILDDGSYHYVLSSVTAAEEFEEYREIWNGIYESFYLT